MPVIRTPEERFANLPDFPFTPRYVNIGPLRIHYVEQGAGEVVLCLHGEPSWSYLYRKMIPPLAARHRVIAPDLVGFGRSDKYTEPHEYSFQMHVTMMKRFVEILDLRSITLVVQDWGGLIGLRIATEMPERFTRLVIMNTGLPTGEGRVPRAFRIWREFAAANPDLPVGDVIRMGLAHGEEVPPEVIAAYEAPFPDGSYKAGAAIFPMLVPLEMDAPGAAEMRQAREVLSRWEKPVQVMFSDSDPITRGGDRLFRELIPGAKGQPEITIQGAGHFLQEEKGPEIAREILAFMDRTPLP